MTRTHHHIEKDHSVCGDGISAIAKGPGESKPQPNHEIVIENGSIIKREHS